VADVRAKALEVKVKVSVHTMKAYWESKGIIPLILNPREGTPIPTE
jgi:hypothetical protein